MGTDSAQTFTAKRFGRFMREEMTERLRLGRSDDAREKYSADQVHARVNAANFPPGWALWTVALLCTRPEFVRYSAAQGIGADYRQTRDTALAFISPPASAALAASAVGAAALAAAGVEHERTSPSIGDMIDIADAGLDLVDMIGGLFDLLGSLG